MAAIREGQNEWVSSCHFSGLFAGTAVDETKTTATIQRRPPNATYSQRGIVHKGKRWRGDRRVIRGSGGSWAVRRLSRPFAGIVLIRHEAAFLMALDFLIKLLVL